MLEPWRYSVLYLLSLAAYGTSQSSHDTTISGSTPSLLGETTITSAPSAVTSTSLQGNATCHSRTANYITHTLPQQCLRTNRAVATASSGQNAISSANKTSSSMSSRVTNATVAGPPIQRLQSATASTTEPLITSVSLESPISASATASTTSGSSLPTLEAAETETDSPLDNANFLSFEDWKKQNLAKAGQSPENLAGRAQPIDADRRRPGINNALDTFGEENEIELDFSGFGGNFEHTGETRPSGTPENAAAVQSSPAQQAHRSKDAGKTCKERTNYASFDCAATILKNNPESKSASSVLVENKDSYMLNKCSASNKFIIIELCNDILIDTLVLANYEFFSSIFRHFRISVSDRYPVKMEKWKTLGTFEARNTREVQAFLIENPLIWARYLRIEFLTHYGNEYFCPVSLLRVHGTTMMDEFRHQEEIARGEPQDDDVVLEPEVAAEVVAAQEPGNVSPEVEKETVQAIPTVDVEVASAPSTVATDGEASEADPHSSTTATSVGQGERSGSSLLAEYEYFVNSTCAIVTSSLLGTSTSTLDTADASTAPTSGSSSQITSLPIDPTGQVDQNRQSDTASINSSSLTIGSTSPKSAQSSAAPLQPEKQSAPDSDSHSASMTSTTTTTTTDQRSTPPPSRSHSESSPQQPPKPAPTTNSTRPSTTNPTNPPQPSTQESFFKSVSKRLQSLESNSTLSLQYIEEQSRILRTAFSAVEKRQISSATTFLSHVNDTVMHELHGFRTAYDQLWQSTVIELEGQREVYQREMLALSTRLTLVADELVWQKRMGIAQSTLLLLCLALVLFNRAAPGGLEMPGVQAMMHKSQAALRAGFESPPNSPSPDGGSRSPVSLFRRKVWRGSEPASGRGSEGGSRPVSSGGLRVDVEPPTPSDGSGDEGEGEVEDDEEEGEWKEVPETPEVQSGPATPSGLRDENGPPQWPEEVAQTSSPVQMSP